MLGWDREDLRAMAHYHGAPEVEVKARRDLRTSTMVLAGIGFMSLLSLATSASEDLPPWIRVPLFLALVVSAASWIVIARRSPGTALNSAGRIAISLLAGAGILVLVGVALIFGLIIYLLVLCSGHHF
jgi:hypothetical protein